METRNIKKHHQRCSKLTAREKYFLTGKGQLFYIHYEIISQVLNFFAKNTKNNIHLCKGKLFLISNFPVTPCQEIRIIHQIGQMLNISSFFHSIPFFLQGNGSQVKLTEWNHLGTTFNKYCSSETDSHNVWSKAILFMF